MPDRTQSHQPATRDVEFTFSGQQVVIAIPVDPEQMLDEAIRHETDESRETDPYWGLLWDAAPRTAEFLMNQTLPSGGAALELGCGIGLAGIGALFAGLKVTFSDLVPAAVDLAVANARANGFPDASGLVLDWLVPIERRFDVILASDVLYDAQNHGPLLNVLDRMLTLEGTVWIGDAGRHHTAAFVERAQADGWETVILDGDGRTLPAPVHVQFQMLKLSR